MKSVNLCINYSGHPIMPETLRSAFEGSVVPDYVYVVNQTGKCAKWMKELVPAPLRIHDLGEKRGCESSAINYFLTMVPEERVISHDDVIFGPESLEKFVNTPGLNLADTALGLISFRDECVRRVGLYDTEISPNFYRYNDVDYMHRCALADIWPVMIDCGVTHTPGGTMRTYTPEQERDYWERVELARQNYVKKWGAMPERDPRTGQWM